MDEFYTYACNLIKNNKLKQVVEINSDSGLDFAFEASKYCNRYYSLHFEKDFKFMQDKLKSKPIKNIEILAGNPFLLPEIMQQKGCKPDLLILNEAYFSESWNDTNLFWKYFHCIDHLSGIHKLSDPEIENIPNLIEQNDELAYRRFLKLINPGYILRFDSRNRSDSVLNLFLNRLKIPPAKIESHEFKHNGNPWEAYLVHNY